MGVTYLIVALLRIVPRSYAQCSNAVRGTYAFLIFSTGAETSSQSVSWISAARTFLSIIVSPLIDVEIHFTLAASHVCHVTHRYESDR